MINPFSPWATPSGLSHQTWAFMCLILVWSLFFFDIMILIRNHRHKLQVQLAVHFQSLGYPSNVWFYFWYSGYPTNTDCIINIYSHLINIKFIPDCKICTDHQIYPRLQDLYRSLDVIVKMTPRHEPWYHTEYRRGKRQYSSLWYILEYIVVFQRTLWYIQ